MMFRCFATLGAVIDLTMIIYFLVHPDRIFDDLPPTWIEFFHPAHSFFPDISLALVRIASMTYYIYVYSVGSHFPNIFNIYWWLFINLVIGALTWLLMKKSNSVLLVDSTWILFSLTFSIISHVICLRHLRSSIVMIPSFSLGLGDKLQQAIDGQEFGVSAERIQSFETKNMKECTDNQHFLTTSNDQSDFSILGQGNHSNNLLRSLRSRISSAHSAWNSSLSMFRHSIIRKYDGILMMGHNSPSGILFYKLFSIFIGDNSISIKMGYLKDIEEIFRESPDKIAFFIPQLVVYLFYGALELENALQSSLLEMCKQNLTFAYKLEWYLESFCLHDEGGMHSDEYWNESQNLILNLVGAIRREGALACRRVINTPQNDSFCNFYYGSIPRAIEKYPLYLTKEVMYLGRVAEYTNPTMELFGEIYSGQLKFWNTLVDISKHIVSLPLLKRREALQEKLRCVVAEFLPSAVIHVPFNNYSHRVFNIHIEECFTFSTKTRAPLLICLEVVHFVAKPRNDSWGKRWWNISSSKKSIMKTPFYAQQENYSFDSVANTRDGFDLELNSQPSFLGGSKQSYQPCFATDAIDDQEEFYQSSTAISRKNSLENLQYLVREIKTSTHLSNDSISSDIRQDIKSFGQWMSPIRENTWHVPSKQESPTNLIVDTSKSSFRSDQTDIYVSPIRGSVNTNLLTDFELEKSYETSDESCTVHLDLYFSPTIPQQSSISQIEDPSRESTESVDADMADHDSCLMSPDSLVYSSEMSSLNVTENNTPKFLSPRKEKIQQRDFDSTVRSCIIFKEKWRDKEDRIRPTSPVGKCPGWNLIPVIVKSNDDLRQEQLASQTIRYMHIILEEARIECWLRPYEIIALSSNSGLIEAIPNTVSLDLLKRQEFGYLSLPNFFEEYFGPKHDVPYKNAVENFINSLAGYSIVCYLLNLKDRHNGNILLTTHGHIMHIDFGFMLENTPGGNIGFEAAPFKLTAEFVSVMGGEFSAGFSKFRSCCLKTFLELRRHHERVILMMEMMSKGNENLPCFGGDPLKALSEMRRRFFPDLNDSAASDAVDDLINRSLDNWTTRAYDGYQRCCQGIQ